MTNTNEPTATSEILRLAALSLIEYDLQRKEAAERLNIRADTLDKEVKLSRLHTQDNASGNGKNLSMPEDELYPEPVDGAALLNELADTFSRYAVTTEATRLVPVKLPSYWVSTVLLSMAYCSEPLRAV